MNPLNHDKNRRLKNQLKSKNAILGYIILGVIVSSVISAFSASSNTGFFLLFIVLAVFTAGVFHTRKINKFYQYADEFENNDTWLPKNFEIKLPTTIQKIMDSSADEVREEMGVKKYVETLEAELEFIHKHKRKTQKKQNEWQTIQIPINEKFWKVETRMNLSGRTAIYSADERAHIQRDFIDQIDYQDQLIAKVNKLLNKAIDKGSEIQRGNINISNIEGLNS
ncbi:hypothetical protein [uncultured Kordia sp.]|uniref:hypothetical protein n=1 Tax=uncultured Kordia sp. TaxID=507699 RepID=UPI0026368B44|nr:hypothetical protein [uncultured Kordia sp.]